MRLLCLVGWHTWVIEREEEIPDNGEDAAVLWEPGGVDYHCRCVRCPATKIISRRGVWQPPKYPSAKA